MRKIFSLLIASMLAFLSASPIFAASITVSIFPVYDWLREISKGVSNDITLLLDSGADIHSYQPSAEDIVSISESDLFVYVGGESDEWAEDALKIPGKTSRRVINLLDVLGDSVKPEELVEGMQHNHEHEEHEHDSEHHHEHEEHEHESAHEHHEHEHEEPDEHIWLSLRNAEKICRKLAETLSEADPSHKNIYESNARTYAGKLSSLDKEYISMVRDSKRKVILVADRFPFRYLADDYGLKYYAAFSGCSAESEASFETVIFLAQKSDELNLPCVLKIDGANHKIAETVISSSKNHGRKILTLDSMQSASKKDIDAGRTYLDVMRSNLEILKGALN